MICPNCENGKVFHPMAHLRVSREFGRYVLCQRCKGSGIENRTDIGSSDPEDFFEEMVSNPKELSR